MAVPVRIENWVNGDSFTKVAFYRCDKCSQEICESFPHVFLSNGTVLCEECGFLSGSITEHEYLDAHGICTENAHASIRKDKVIIWTGNRAPWDKNIQDIRKSSAYQKWRRAVFERDKYICQICGQVGGRLNAHHIKPFARFPDSRLDVSNGLTLCEECHRNIHRKRKVHRGERSISNK